VSTSEGLEQAEFFRALGPSERARVRAAFLERRFARQRVLYAEGSRAEHLWLLRRGEVRLYKCSPEGRLTTLETLRPGEIFGALSALVEDAYPASAEAVTQVEAWCLPRQRLLRLLEEQPRLALELLEVVSRRLREAQDRMRSLAQDPAPARLAGALLRAARGGEAAVTRRALAEASGTTLETAIRVLRRFERAGLIRGEVGRVHLVDVGALARIAAGESG
jgi:CRP/FNR family transcriptional regulator